MKRLLVLLLSLYKKITLLFIRLKGSNPMNEAEKRVISGRSWSEFCDTLKAAGAAISSPGTPKDAFNQAEGYRYLSRLTRAGLEAFVEYADAKAPVLRRMVHETVKMGADNPDNHYYNARISGEYEYRITGSRGTVHFLGLSTQKGHYGEGGAMPATGFLDAADMEIGADGSLEITVSCRRQPGNWLPMEKQSGMIFVRQTFLDRENEVPAELKIERIGDDCLPAALSAETVDKGLNSASTLVAGASMLFMKWANDFKKHINELPRFDQERSNSAGGDPKIAYYHSYWKLEEDEALEITVEPPECEHWNFQLNNHWMESLDYRYFRIHINKHSAVYREDGSVRIIIAGRNPGCDNWLSTCGHRQGTMCFRWIKAAAHPQPRTRILKIDDV